MFDKVLEVAVRPTITAGAYSAADVVGGRMTFAVSSASGNGELVSLAIADDDNEKAAGTFYLFSGAPSAIADNAAFAPTIADLKLLIAQIPISAADYETINGNAVIVVDGLEREYQADGSNNLYGYFVCAATPTYTAITDLTFTLTVKTAGG